MRFRLTRGDTTVGAISKVDNRLLSSQLSLASRSRVTTTGGIACSNDCLYFLHMVVALHYKSCCYISSSQVQMLCCMSLCKMDGIPPNIQSFASSQSESRGSHLLHYNGQPKSPQILMFVLTCLLSLMRF